MALITWSHVESFLPLSVSVRNTDLQTLKSVRNCPGTVSKTSERQFKNWIDMLMKIGLPFNVSWSNYSGKRTLQKILRAFVNVRD